MTQPIEPFRSRELRGDFRDDPPDPPKAGSPRSLPELRDLPDTNADLLARATRAKTSGPPLLAALKEATTPLPQQLRLDAFLARSTPTYRIGTEDVPVAIPFRMSLLQTTKPADSDHARLVTQNGPAITQAAASHGVPPIDVTMVRMGRGTPEQVQRVTQALIDSGKLPTDGRPTGERVRQMMFDHGIGVDCAGYTQQAFLWANGATRAAAGFGDIRNESLSGLAHRGYTSVLPVAARPGDLVVLHPRQGQPPETGHTAIVYSARLASADDLKLLAAWSHQAMTVASGGIVHVFEVDSSWGSDGNPQQGGVKRETWWYEERSQLWVWRDANRRVGVSIHPYDHPVDGFYRAPAGVSRW